MARWGTGCIAEMDGFQHAYRHRHLRQDVALCGAGRVALHVLGEFDPADRSACPRCALLVIEATGELAPAAARLGHQFPDLPSDVITSTLTDSYCAVVGLTARPLVAKAEDLTRLVLEVRTRHPAQVTAVAPSTSHRAGRLRARDGFTSRP